MVWIPKGKDIMTRYGCKCKNKWKDVDGEQHTNSCANKWVSRSHRA